MKTLVDQTTQKKKKKIATSRLKVPSKKRFPVLKKEVRQTPKVAEYTVTDYQGINKEWLDRLIHNAEDLLQEAEILRKHGKGRRAFFLILLAFEQSVKARRLLKKEFVKRESGHKSTLGVIDKAVADFVSIQLVFFKDVITGKIYEMGLPEDILNDIREKMTVEVLQALKDGYAMSNEFKTVIPTIKKFFDMTRIRNNLLYEDEISLNIFLHPEKRKPMDSILDLMSQHFIKVMGFVVSDLKSGRVIGNW